MTAVLSPTSAAAAARAKPAHGRHLVLGAAAFAALAVHLAPVTELFSVYVVMAVVLMFRPEGLFQRIQARKI